jgi:hypothetical protein
MSAFAYINIEDVPADLRESSDMRIDDITEETLISFDGCPLVGQMGWSGITRQVEYPFPRNPQIRNDLVNWFVHWGIHFRVVF